MFFPRVVAAYVFLYLTMLRTLLILPLCLWLTMASAVNLDSLWGVWNDKSQPDTNRLEAMRKIAWDGYLFSQPDTAYHLAQQQYDFAEFASNKNYMASALNIQGISSGITGNYELALKRFIHACNLHESLNNKKSLAGIQGNLGLVYIKLGKHMEAIEIYGKCMKIQEELKDSSGLANSLDNLGIIYYEQGLNEQALSYYIRCLEIVKHLGKKRNMAAYALVNIGAIYTDSEDYLKGRDHFMEALLLGEELHDNILTSNALIGLGQIEQKLGNHSLAMEYYYMALVITQKLGDKEAISSSLLGLAASHALQGNHGKAIEHGSDALEIAFKIPTQTRSAAKILYESYKAIGKNRKALEMHELYIQMHDSIVNNETQKASIRQQFKFTYEKKAAADSLRHVAAINEQDIKIAFQNKLGFTLVIFLLSILVFSILLFKRFQITRDQKQIIEAASTRTKDSIMYAKRIQYSILPSMGYIENCLDEFFILYKPKDIVSGDFYWIYKQKNGNIFIVLADCTGHGVPGAFMSMICTALLNETIIENGVTKVNEVLNTIREHIIKSFEQEGLSNHVNDGMDITLIDLDLKNGRLWFAGAGQSLYILRDEEIITLKGNHCPVGYYFGRETPFDCQELEVFKGDQLYLFSDGVVDQFGGRTRKKFTFKRLKELILQGGGLPMAKQKEMLEEAVTSWRGNQSQTDDISIMGVKV